MYIYLSKADKKCFIEEFFIAACKQETALMPSRELKQTENKCWYIHRMKYTSENEETTTSKVWIIS